jgi:SAM-dependent methyltransferase
MDEPCSFEELRVCLQGISRVNRVVRAYHPILDWLGHIYATMPRQTRPIHIVDVGSGYGDTLRRIHLWAEDHGLPVTLTGIDLNPNAVRAAREATPPGVVTYLAGNAFDFHPPGGIDLVISSLTTHHMEDVEIVEFLRWMEQTARMGWFINDLHRQPMPYLLFPLLAFVMRLPRFPRHDGRVSILRSFRREDWQRLCTRAGLAPDSYLIREYQPARLCVARLRSLAPKVKLKTADAPHAVLQKLPSIP